MPTMEVSNKEDLEDLILGLKFFGTGGGGDAHEGFQLLQRELDEGRTIKWIDLDSIQDDSWTARISNTGTTGSESDEDRQRRFMLGLGDPTEIRNHATAVNELANYTGCRIDTLIPPELGSRNTAVTLAIGAYLGLNVADADYAGRAIPELSNTTPCIMGHKIWPIAAVDKWGNTCIIKKVANVKVAERFARHLAMSSFGSTGLAGFLLKGSVAKEIAIPGTLTESFKLGKSIRIARENGEDPIKNILDVTEGKLLFIGKIKEKQSNNRGGFLWGEHFIEGSKEYSSKTMKIWFKNENLISWLGDEPYVTCPDLISIVEYGTGLPLSNPEVKEGQEVAVIGIRARDIYSTKKGINALSPKYFGYNFEYRPIDKIV